jgi:hypothetical protein
MREPIPLFAFVLLASAAAFACSGPPAPYRRQVLTVGSRNPAVGASGASSAAVTEGAGPNASVDGGSEPVPACTALALCCSAMDMSDPAKGWCQETLTDSSPDECSAALFNFGCGS